MSGFVAQPGSIDPNADVVAGDAFWPGCSLAAFRSSTRAAYAIDEERLRDAMRGGMLAVRGELAEWKSLQVAAGTNALADIAAETVDGVNALELLYTRAVFAYAAADLIQTHNPVSATNEGRERIDDEVPSADHYRRVATHAIRDILGVTRTAVELI